MLYSWWRWHGSFPESLWTFDQSISVGWHCGSTSVHGVSGTTLSCIADVKGAVVNCCGPPLGAGDISGDLWGRGHVHCHWGGSACSQPCHSVCNWEIPRGIIYFHEKSESDCKVSGISMNLSEMGSLPSDCISHNHEQLKCKWVI